MPWTKANIPSLKGKIAIVTGSYGGLGYEVVLGLVEAEATVIIAGRNESKGIEALEKIRAICPNANVSFDQLDLNDLASVSKFCKDFKSKNEKLDILVNNAGIMMPPKRLTTQDGLELQMQTNYLAHFALTAQLLSVLKQSSQPRVVNVSSFAARKGAINFDDLQSEKSYSPMVTYNQSKLASLLFTFELQRRSDKEGWNLMALTAHPGYSRTDLVSNGPRNNSCFGWAFRLFRPIFSQSAAEGALCLLYAATSNEAKPSGYYGPQGFYETKGQVGDAWVPVAAKDTEAAVKLWEVSVDLTKSVWD